MSARESLHREVAVAWAMADGRLVSFNPTLLGWLDDQRPQRLEQMLPGLTPARWEAWRLSGFAEVLSLEIAGGRGDPIAVQVQGDLAPGGLLMLTLLGSLPATERLAIDALQRVVLGAGAGGESLAAVMDLLCREVESLAPELMCSVLLVDAAGRVHPLAAPSLPAAYSQALDGMRSARWPAAAAPPPGDASRSTCARSPPTRCGRPTRTSRSASAWRPAGPRRC